MKSLPLYVAFLAAAPLAANGFDPYLTPPNTGYYLNEVEVEYLLWYANQDGLAFATVNNFEQSTLNVTSDEHDQFFKPRWDSGVRATLGFKPADRSWDTRLVYSYFATKIHPRSILGNSTQTSSVPPLGTAIIPDFVPVDSYFNLVESEIHESFYEFFDYTLDPSWKLYFNLIDIEVGKDLRLGSTITFRPFIGVRGIFTNQRFEELITVSSLLNQGPSFPLIAANQTYIFSEKNQFNGGGARGGLDLNFPLLKGLSFYGNFAAGILWGAFSVRQEVNEYYSSAPVSDALTLINVLGEKFNHSHQSSVFNFDITLGLEWNYLFNCNQNMLTFKAGWEQHLFTNINQFQNFISVTNETAIASRNVQRGDLSLSGFFFGLEYSF
jgi:hypothetical protein